MPDREFAVIRDHDGDTKNATVKQFFDLQAQGYRVADVAAYQAALADASTPVAEPESNAGVQAMAEQGVEDAAAFTAEQYPDAKPAAADKPQARKKE